MMHTERNRDLFARAKDDFVINEEVAWPAVNSSEKCGEPLHYFGGRTSGTRLAPSSSS